MEDINPVLKPVPNGINLKKLKKEDYQPLFQHGGFYNYDYLNLEWALKHQQYKVSKLSREEIRDRVIQLDQQHINCELSVVSKEFWQPYLDLLTQHQLTLPKKVNRWPLNRAGVGGFVKNVNCAIDQSKELLQHDEGKNYNFLAGAAWSLTSAGLYQQAVYIWRNIIAYLDSLLPYTRVKSPGLSTLRQGRLIDWYRCRMSVLIGRAKAFAYLEKTQSAVADYMAVATFSPHLTYRSAQNRILECYLERYKLSPSPLIKTFAYNLLQRLMQRQIHDPTEETREYLLNIYMLSKEFYDSKN